MCLGDLTLRLSRSPKSMDLTSTSSDTRSTLISYLQSVVKIQNKKKTNSRTYMIYCRHKHAQSFSSVDDAKQNTEVILDLEEIPFISKSMLRKTLVDKVKMNDDHSLVAFTLDIGNTERITGGIKDMGKNEVLRNVKLEGISQIEFGEGRDTIFYVETDH